MPRTRVSPALYLLAVFVSGILVGLVSYRLYVTATVSATANTPPRTADEVRAKYLKDMRASVGVDDKQISSVVGVLDNTKRKFDDLNAREKTLHDQIHQEMIEQISALLTPQQKTAYDNWRAERARKHALEQQKKQQK